MNTKLDDIFTPDYVGKEQTGDLLSKPRSTIKELLKSPIDEKEMVRYGTSKPYRKVLVATIQHGKD